MLWLVTRLVRISRGVFASGAVDKITDRNIGEIGAAYAAGLLSARDAIRAAYYRGLYANLAKSPHGGKGSSTWLLLIPIYTYGKRTLTSLSDGCWHDY